MNRQIGGIAYWRIGDVKGGEVRTIMSRRTVKDEITADEAAAANALIPDFDNLISKVSLLRHQVKGPQLVGDGVTAVPGPADVDWLKTSNACAAPAAPMVAAPAAKAAGA
jgi:hypothetical protein